MATETASIPDQPARARRIVRAVTHGPLNVFLMVVALLWLVPTVGLFVASLRDAADNGESGWWTAVLRPAQLTLQSYKHIIENPDIVRSFWNTVLITVPASILVVIVAALAAYAFAWIPFRGRDWIFLVVVALLVVPLQIALIPVARLYDITGL
ncbi:MAG: carbohydrate ABC transporter permease, partial [Actinomycetota bacterium]|nr:carbohydrate ABC transporter permease [Actinomycetota bacterium]